MIGALCAVLQAWPIDGDNSDKDETAGKDIDEANKPAHHASRMTSAFKCPLDGENNGKVTCKKDGDGRHEVSHGKEVQCQAEDARKDLAEQRNVDEERVGHLECSSFECPVTCSHTEH